MKLRISIVFATLIIVAAVGLYALHAWRVAPAEGGNALTPVTVRLKWVHQAQFAGFYVALEKGFYRQKGLDVKLLPGGSDFPAVQLVSSGAEDFGVTGADQVILARAKAVPVVAVEVIYRKSPFCYFTKKSSGIVNAHDFIGKNIGVKLGGNEEITYRAMMKQAGVNTGSLHEIPVKFDMSEFFSDQVVAWPGYSINEPIVAEEQGISVNYIWPSDYGVSLYADTLFTTDRMIRDKPDIVSKVVKATAEGWDYATSHPAEAVEDTLKQNTSLHLDHEMRMLTASLPLLKPGSLPFGVMEQQKWSDMQTLLLESGFLKSQINLDTVFTNKFLTADQ